MAESLEKHLCGKGVVHGDSVAQQHEAQLLQLNCDKAHQVLGWQPRWIFDQTLTMTADWYKRVIAGEEAKIVTHSQIVEYFPEMKI